MSKRKKKKSPWNAFVSRIFTHRREDRDIMIPRDYLLSIADNLHRTNPTKEIIYNTLVGMAGVLIEKGYNKRMSDATWFKQRQNKHFEEDFGQFLDYLDDMAHRRELLTFAVWEKNQRQLKNQSNNQPK
jgi:hypothetical protein